MSPLEVEKTTAARPVRAGRASRALRDPSRFERSRSLVLLRRQTLSHVNNLRKKYGDYDDNRKEERGEDHEERVEDSV
jgi:hypothetical protein